MLTSRTSTLLTALLLLGCGRTSILADSVTSQPDAADASITDADVADVQQEAAQDTGKPDAPPAVCDLEVLAAGPLAGPETQLAAISGIDAVATPFGFVIVFQEVDHGVGRVHRVTLEDAGVLMGRETGTDTACESPIAGVAAAWNDVDQIGLVAAACGSALNLTTVDERGDPIQDVGGGLTEAFPLAASDAVSAGDGPEAFYLASTVFGEGTLFTAFGTMLTAGITIMPDSENATSAHVASTGKLTAMVADADYGQAPYSLTWGNIHLPDLTTLELASGTTAAVEAWQDRVVAAVSSEPGVSWWEVDATTGETTRGEVAMPDAVGLEVLRLRDHLFVLGSDSGEITVVALDDRPAGRVEAVRKTLDVAGDLPSIGQSSGALLASAAARDTLLVAWAGSAVVLDTDDYVGSGGFAMLRCSDSP